MIIDDVKIVSGTYLEGSGRWHGINRVDVVWEVTDSTFPKRAGFRFRKRMQLRQLEALESGPVRALWRSLDVEPQLFIGK